MAVEQLQNYELSTDLATQIELNGLSSEIVDGLSGIADKLSTVADLVTAEVQKVDNLSNDLSDVYAPYGRKVRVNSNSAPNGILDLTFDSSHFSIDWEDSEPEPGSPPDPDAAGTIRLKAEYIDSKVSAISGLESRISAIETELSGVLSALQEINGTGEESPTYTGFIPTGDPLIYSVTNENGTPTTVSRQIQGPPYSWFSSSTTGNYSDNGTFKFEFDGDGHIVVTADSNLTSIYTVPPYAEGDTVAIIDQSTFIPTSVNGSFEWLETL